MLILKNLPPTDKIYYYYYYYHSNTTKNTQPRIAKKCSFILFKLIGIQTENREINIARINNRIINPQKKKKPSATLKLQQLRHTHTHTHTLGSPATSQKPQADGTAHRRSQLAAYIIRDARFTRALLSSPTAADTDARGVQRLCFFFLIVTFEQVRVIAVVSDRYTPCVSAVLFYDEIEKIKLKKKCKQSKVLNFKQAV